MKQLISGIRNLDETCTNNGADAPPSLRGELYLTR